MTHRHPIEVAKKFYFCTERRKLTQFVYVMTIDTNSFVSADSCVSGRQSAVTKCVKWCQLTILLILLIDCFSPNRWRQPARQHYAQQLYECHTQTDRDQHRCVAADALFQFRQTALSEIPILEQSRTARAIAGGFVDLRRTTATRTHHPFATQVDPIGRSIHTAAI